MKKIIMFIGKIFKNIGKVLFTVIVDIPVWCFLIIVNSLATPFVIMRWVFAGSSIRNNGCNGMFHRLYFHTSYRGQQLFNKVWKN